MSAMKRVALAAIAFVALSAASVYLYVRSGGMIARQKPGQIETAAARVLLDVSVPATAKESKNPVAATDASLTSGRVLYQKKCETCHGYDGAGKTDAGGGLYPPPIDLRGNEVRKSTDGELFYFIRNGIRNTAMPGWQMPDMDTWQLVTFIRNLPKVAAVSPESSAAPGNSSGASAQYVGSAACKDCHSRIYERWSKTRMANVVTDPKAHPEVIIPDLARPDPLVTFTKADIALVYGSKWKQRYFTKVGDDYFPLPAQWDVSHKMWRAYHVPDGADWWVPFYPSGNLQRPTGPLCDGCHSVNYNIATKAVTEWNVGCEKCHGPGSAHVKTRSAADIVNPSRLDYVEANNVCIQCHSQGKPVKSPIEGKYYDWPVGFAVGHKLGDFWKLEEHKPGETSFTHFADGTAHKNRMQGNDYAASLMYNRGVTCFTCHDAHGSANDAILRKPASSVCLDCHGPTSPNGPHAPTVEQHTHHKAGSAGGECIACHMPKIEQTIAGVNVRSHTFHFVYPATTDSVKVPNACNVCHTDMSTAWATAAMKTWPDRSPWRIDQ